MYKSLKYLQELLNQDDFEKDFMKFLDILKTEDSTREMFFYLKNNYLNNRQQWAYCYRKKKGINTNMFLESMHKVVKYEYLNGKKVKRLDKTLHCLQKFMTDKSVDRLIKLTKGKNLKQLVDIKKRHRSAQCNDFRVTVEDNSYIFHTENDQTLHLVSKVNQDVCCELKCSYCNICWHTFECSCLDYQIKSMICKHIHFVVLKYMNISEPVPNIILQEKKEKEIQMLTENMHTDFSNFPPGSFDTESKKDKIKNAALNIIANINSLHYSEEEYEFILKNLNVLNSLGSKTKVIKPAEYTVSIITEPANKNIVPQKTFFSTKKKRKHVGKFTKPCTEETNLIQETLMNSLFMSKDSAHDHRYDL